MSKGFERKLTAKEELELKAHLAICKTCVFCLKQVKSLSNLFNKYTTAITKIPPSSQNKPFTKSTKKNQSVFKRIVIVSSSLLCYKRNMTTKKYKGFTLLEIVIVVLILGVIVTFALSNFTKVLASSKLRNAYNNVLSAHTAANIYETMNGFLPADNSPPSAGNCVASDTAYLNTTLGLNIEDDNYCYYFNNDNSLAIEIYAEPYSLSTSDYNWHEICASTEFSISYQF